MNQKNWLLIFIFISIGLGGCYFYFKNQKETSLVSESETTTEPLFSEEMPTSPRPKRSVEEEKPKFKTTNARLEQIKNYLFTEPINSTLLPTDLSEREQEEINELKKSWQSSLDLLKEQKTWIDENQNECDEYQSQLNSIPSEIKSWENKKTPLKIQLETKEKELNRLKIDRKANETQIKKLQAEILEIVVEIKYINIQIGKLENKQEKYQDMLTRAEGLKKDSEKSYERSEKEFKNLIYSQLNELYEITSAEG
ncbi:MAG: effector [Candidatus Phytoplasma stylosanthis]|uniref:effector n=1 Tax=Candidatus Phytoplasma stylosanthis TaxID=2798314 RepID=UPI0029398AB7|nr:effector [Candidatus Phytoplasma stylosanthis]MDV3168192.1 effector [Candidatus Phytoplasma stylosanthis]